MIESSEVRKKIRDNFISYQEKMKSIFDRKEKETLFQERDLVLRWDTGREDKGNHGKFENSLVWSV